MTMAFEKAYAHSSSLSKMKKKLKKKKQKKNMKMQMTRHEKTITIYHEDVKTFKIC